MASCEEASCLNLQSAICLHCHRHLCISHIAAHGTSLLEEADELCEQINKIAEDVNDSLQHIRTKKEQAVVDTNAWRQNEIAKIEGRYAKKIQAIGSQEDMLVELGSRLSQRLVKDAREPLERMQRQKSANSQIIQATRQVLVELKQESKRLEWNPVDQESFVGVSEGTTNDILQQQQRIQSINQRQVEANPLRMHAGNERTTYPVVRYQYYSPSQFNPLFGGNRSPMMYTGPARNHLGNGPYLPMYAQGFSPVVRPQPGATHPPISSIACRPHGIISPTISNSYRLGSSSAFVEFSQNRFVSTGSPIDTKALPITSNTKITDFFLNVSSSNTSFLDQLLLNSADRNAYLCNVMTALLSFLEAWHSKTSATGFNERVLSHHIFTVKRYIYDQDLELVAIAAIVSYIITCDYNEMQSSRIMNSLLHQFFAHNCITRTTILDWFENGAKYDYSNFERAKHWVAPFIEYLRTNAQAK